MATLDDFSLMSTLDVDFVEILVRQSDQIEDLSDFLKETTMEIIVHAPEKLVHNGAQVLLDLASVDQGIREASCKRIQSLAKMLKRWEVPLVVHPGGVTYEKVESEGLFRNLTSSLEEIHGRVWLENMPRRYHRGDELWFCNLMLHPEDFLPILDVVDGVTLDVSHAYLSVPQGGNSAISSFFSALKGRIKHIHLSDAAYPHKEGLPLGEGEVDLNSLPRMKALPILLEIWGGHLHEAEGFKKALELVKGPNTWFRGCVA